MERGDVYCIKNELDLLVLKINVHSHSVLGTLRLSPKYHAIHLVLKPSYHGNFMLYIYI
jgi:hypothetical protein